MTSHRPASVSRLMAAACLAVAAAACARALPAAKYPLDQCRRVALVDAGTGAVIRGAEDLALDLARERLIVSAYDRRGAERALRKRAPSVPQGGLYAISIAALAGDDRPVAASALAHGDDIAGGLRPHGITYDPITDEIAFINRGYQKLDGRWRSATRIERIGAGGEVVIGAEVEARCAANDLARDGEGLLITFDHSDCGWRKAVEDALSLRRSGVASENGATLYDAAAHANGIVEVEGGDIALAATREKAVLILERTPEGYAERRRIHVPGGPDNLALAADGGIIAALHPSLLRMGLHRKTGFGKSPSRVVNTPLDGAGIEFLFDDPSGAVFSGATAAVEWSGRLILGSATDEGLLVCASRA